MATLLYWFHGGLEISERKVQGLMHRFLFAMELCCVELTRLHPLTESFTVAENSIMKITEPTNSPKPKKQGKPKFKPQHIPSSNCCGRCLFNIPSGTLLWLLPSLMLLFIGVVMVILDKDGSWLEGLLQVGSVKQLKIFLFSHDLIRNLLMYLIPQRDE